MPLDSIAVLSPLDRATDANGDPVPGAVLYFYEAGTSTPKTVYSDSDLTQSLGTSVVCDAGGFPTSDGSTRVMIYTGTAAYKLVVKDADGVTLWTLDDIPGAPVIPDVASAALPETPVISRTSSYQIVPGDKGKLINADPTGGSFAITLPSAVTVGDKWRIGVRHNGPATANVVAVRSTGGQTIQGPGQTAATSMALTGLGQCFWFVSDGAGWTIDGSAEPLMASGGVVYFKATDRLSAPPSSPVGGQRYIINSTPTGVWATLGFAEKDIAESDGNGSWLKYTPANGYMAWVDDENLISVYHDGAWEDWSNVTAPQSSALNVLELYYDGSGTNTIAATTWTKLLHNATAKNSITGASVSSGAVTLPTGNYLVFGSFSALIPQSVGVNVRGRFYSTTNSAVKIGSVNNRNANVASQNVAANPHFFGFVGVTSATETFEHQWWSTSNQVTLATTDTGSTGAITDRFAILTILKLDAVQGPRGAQGLQGVDGLDAAYAYQWDTGTSGDPGSGKVGLNNATPASATQLRISETDAYGANLSAVFATWDDSTSSIKARVKISKEGATQNFVEALITGAGTDQGAYWTFPITYVAAGGTISASNNVAVIVIEKGDKGDTGANGTTVPDISGLTEDTAPDPAADYLIEYDTSAAGHKKVLLGKLNPMTTRGDMIRRGASAVERVGIGTSGYAWMSDGTDPAWTGFLQAGTGAATRTWLSKAQDFVSVLDFGADPTNTNDSTTAFNNALATGKAVYVPPGTYKISGTLTITLSGTQLIGEGPGASVLSMTSASLRLITVASSLSYVRIAGLTLTRTTTATSPGNGIEFLDACNICSLSDLYIEKQYNGILARATGWSYMDRLVVTECQQDGIKFNNTASNGAMQWQLNDVLSQKNVLRGFLVASVAGPSAVAMGTWRNVATFANSSFGAAFIGTAGVPINGIRISDSFLGEDGNSELYLDTYGGLHKISNSFFELAGTRTTGPTLATGASGAGKGVEITANNTDVVLESPHCAGNSSDGANTAATQITSVVGGRMSNNSGYGAVFADGAKAAVVGVQFNGNSSGTVSYTSNASSAVARGNWPETANVTTTIELGHATDTTFSRVASGRAAIEGVAIVRGPASSTDNAAARFDATTGDLIQDSPLIIADTTGALSRSGNGGIPVQGTNTNDSASAGNIGEYIESVIASGSAVSLTTGTPANITSISLTAGDWDVDLVAQFTGGGSTTVVYLIASISSTSATLDNTNGRRCGIQYNGEVAFNNIANVILSVPVPPLRFSLASTTTIYAVAQAAFGVSTCSVFGILRARRVR